ncbi:hypothetical protein CRUP_037203 [Coryphaenoides rupestris]|nr:hypothetical protein CRUP_037203 [Coryphaenoides rupestris]
MMDKEEPMKNDTSVPKTTRSTPGKRRTPQKTSPLRAGHRTRSVALEEVEEEREETINTPAKRQTRQSTTPTRASRRTTGVTEETVAEENPQLEEEPEKSKRSNTRISKIRYVEAQPALLELEEDEQVVKKKAASSPSRVTRTSSRTTLNIQPQTQLELSKSAARMRGGASTEANALSEPDDAPPSAKSRRSTRSKLCERIVEDLPLLDPPLEVDSQTPVSDALIRRLEDEEEKEAQKGGSPILSGRSPIHMRKRAPVQNESVSPDHAATLPKSRAMIKSTAKSKAALVPLASVDLISPLPSPAESAPRAQKRTGGEGDAAGARLSSRRQRIMDTVFIKPVIRRKKL